MKKHLPIILIYLTSIGLSDYYSDRFLIYIDNSISLFEINENTGRTNLEDLNQKTINQETIEIIKEKNFEGLQI